MSHKFLTEQELDLQEHLTEKRLQLFQAVDHSFDDRPAESLSELMHWAKSKFGECLQGLDLSIYIHNKIVIDGKFLQFSEETGVKVNCLYKDAVTSWKSEFSNEHFLAMGIFLIQKDGLEFLHCALFHKGNQNEDEVSFFVIVSDSKYYQYINFRNEYDKWENNRDRNNLEVEVIGGENIIYRRDLDWDDLFLPEYDKDQIKFAVEGFLSSKHIYEKHKVTWKKGLVFWGSRGTGKTSTLKIIMSQYPELKPVTIQAGHNAMDEILDEAFSYAVDHSPALLYFEDLQELLQEIDISHFLQLLDGVDSKNGLLVIATGNNFNSLEDNIISRPRRFDKKFEFKLPDKDMSKLYLKKWFGQTLNNDQYNKIIKKTHRAKFTYAHLQEIYFSSVFLAIKNNRDDPNEDDILKALDDVMIEKKASDNGLVAIKQIRRDLTDYDNEEDED